MPLRDALHRLSAEGFVVVTFHHLQRIEKRGDPGQQLREERNTASALEHRLDFRVVPEYLAGR